MAVSSYPSAACRRRAAARLADEDDARDRRAQGDENSRPGEAHAGGIDAHLGRGDGIAADGVDVVAEACAMENRIPGRRGDDEENDRRIGNSEKASDTQRSERIWDAEARGGVGGDVDESAHDRHCSERCDEWD